jgi:hypothetical protein
MRVAARGGEEYPLAVSRPADNRIGRWMPGEAFGDAACCRNDIDIRVTVVLAGKGNLLAVGRELRVGFCKSSGLLAWPKHGCKSDRAKSSVTTRYMTPPDIHL